MRPRLKLNEAKFIRLGSWSFVSENSWRMKSLLRKKSLIYRRKSTNGDKFIKG